MHGSLPVRSERHMKKRSKDEKADELRPEYNLHELLEAVYKVNTPTVFEKAPTSCCWTEM